MTSNQDELRQKLIPILMKFGGIFNPIERPNEVNGLTNTAIDTILALLSTEQQALLERVEKEVIGQETILPMSKVHSVSQKDRKFIIQSKLRNELRAEQRKALGKLKLEQFLASGEKVQEYHATLTKENHEVQK